MGNASERRIERVKSLLHSVLAEVIRDELSDPRLGIFSITELHLSRDLSSCELLVAAVGGRERSDEVAKVLNGAAPLLWNRVREQTDLRSVPKLSFKPDHRGEYADRVFELLEEIGPLPEDDDGGTEDGSGSVPPPDSDENTVHSRRRDAAATWEADD